MGPQEDFVETVFTCEGDINDPDLKNRLEDFRSSLKDLLSTGTNIYNLHVLVWKITEVG
jgi:hypothetical protein